MSTCHNSASKGDFAKVVLMPGDPKRAKYIVDNFLENAKLVNDVRGVNGYTGMYKGKPVSVMASGMGIPSIGIYSHELFGIDYDVDCIFRIGSAGSLQRNVQLGDVVIGMGASTNSNYGSKFKLPCVVNPTADFGLVRQAVEEAEAMGCKYHVGNLFSTDTFYEEDDELNKKLSRMGVMAVEMEAAALYMNAAALRKKALAICTITDTPLLFGCGMSPKEREVALNNMITIALETGIKVV